MRNEIKELKEIMLEHTAKVEVLIGLVLTKLGPGGNVDGIDEEQCFKEFPLKNGNEIEELERKLRGDVSYKSNLVSLA
jgi:hypothetical protein